MLTCVGLVGCVHAPVQPSAVPLADALFAPPTSPVGADDLFSLSAPMQAFVHDHLSQKFDGAEAHQKLLDALYSRQLLQLQYDDGPTRTAAQAFAQRKGNCLSLVVMTAAFAKALGLEVEYRQAAHTGLWRDDGQTLVRTDHVNLVLTPPPAIGDRGLSRRQSLMVDFLPGDDLAGLRTRAIDERRLIALYLNNRAAESLSIGQVQQAYWWARAAVMQDASALPALNTLGVVYSRSHLPQLAERTFTLALEQQPDDTFALNNLIHVHVTQGHREQAAVLQARLNRLETQPPLQWQAQGRTALAGGDAARALDLFERELDHNGASSSLMFDLALAHYQAGHRQQAETALAQAAAMAHAQTDIQRYHAKLDWLRAQGHP